MMDKAVSYPFSKGADSMRYLPEYREYTIGNTKYKVISVFANKGALKEIYERYVINCEKERTKYSA